MQTTPAPQPATSARPTAPAAKPTAIISTARNIDEYQREAAQRIHAANAQWVHHERPQALLRAVIVARVKVDADGRPSVEILRSPDAEMSQRVLQSVRAAAPLPLPSRSLAGQLTAIGYTESWLFNTDGRFQLRSIALPQKTE